MPSFPANYISFPAVFLSNENRIIKVVQIILRHSMIFNQHELVKIVAQFPKLLDTRIRHEFDCFEIGSGKLESTSTRYGLFSKQFLSRQQHRRYATFFQPTPRNGENSGVLSASKIGPRVSTRISKIPRASTRLFLVDKQW